MSQKYSIAAMLVIASSFVCAADDPLLIVITPSSVEQPRQQANSALTVIEAETIAASNAGSVAELLRGQAGLHVSDLFGDGRQTTIDLRGFGPTAISNTLILVDGRRLNNASDSAAADLSFIDIDDIEQIEILQGSGGVLYGNQAVGGVINIIRKKITQDEASFHLRAGSDAALDLDLSAKKILGQNRLSIAASKQETDNYRDHNAAVAKQWSIRAVRELEHFRAYAEFQAADDDLQTPGALLQDEMHARRQSHPDYSADYFKTGTHMFHMGIDKTLNDANLLHLDYSRRVVDREFIQSFRGFPGSVSTQDRESDMISAKYRVNPQNSSFPQLLLGFEQEQTDYALVTSYGPQTMQQSIRDMYLSSQWGVGASGQLDAGFRYSTQQAEITSGPPQVSIDDAVPVFNLGYSRRLGRLKLFARADQSYRFPTVEEHTSSAQPAIGLATQKGVSLELGAEYQRDQDRYRVTVYQLNLNDEIAYDASKYLNLNLHKTRRQGVILEVSNHWSESMTTRLSATFLDAEISTGPHQGKHLPLVPESTVRGDVSYRYHAGLLLGLEAIAVGDQVFAGDFSNRLPRLPSYLLFNAHLAYDYQNWVLRLRVSNLFNEKYSEKGSLFGADGTSFFPSPERHFALSMQYRF